MSDDGPSVQWPSFEQPAASESVAWSPRIDVVERDGRLVTRVDLPGVNKEDVSILVTDDHFAISGERKRHREERKDSGSRSESEYGTFYRAVPLPEGAKLDDVKVTFSGSVLEVSVLSPVRSDANVRTVELEEAKKAASCAA